MMLESIIERKYGFSKEYRIVQTFFENKEEKNKITFVAEIERKESSIYSIKRKDIKINEKAPDLISEKISEKIGNLFFPLEVETQENGNLMQISNLEEIRERWKILKPKLQEYYDGRLAKEIIKNIGNELESKSTIQNRILNSFFYRLYFLPFREYVKEKENDFELYLPVFPFKSKVKYSIKMIDAKLDEDGKAMMELSGKCIDSRSFEQIINNRKASESDDKENKCSGKINIKYQFNKEDGSVFSISAKIELESKDEKSKKLIHFELYQL